jgi:hypothetical protein
MKVRYWLLALVVSAGALNGIFGTRIGADAADMHSLSEFPMGEFVLAVPALLGLSWLVLRCMRGSSRLLGYPFFGLGAYGLAYGVGEALFHPLNQKPLLSSIALALLGVVLCGSLLLARKLWWHRYAEA